MAFDNDNSLDEDVTINDSIWPNWNLRKGRVVEGRRSLAERLEIVLRSGRRALVKFDFSACIFCKGRLCSLSSHGTLLTAAPCFVVSVCLSGTPSLPAIHLTGWD